MVGFLAYSIAGRDKESLYLIIKEDNDSVWLANGRDRTINNPKKKNKKHVQIIKKDILADVDLAAKDNDDISFSNEYIRLKIKRYINKN